MYAMLAPFRRRLLGSPNTLLQGMAQGLGWAFMGEGRLTLNGVILDIILPLNLILQATAPKLLAMIQQ
jgi:hypothetical protein